MYPESDPSKEDIKDKTTTVLPECWNAIRADHFDTLVKSMPDRVPAIVKANRWHTKYQRLYMYI
jgi:hypothetical protein